MICALISPTFSLIKSRQSFLPAIIASRASFTQAGQRESVCRGKPSVGVVFSHYFSSGLSDHFGVTEGFGLRLLKYWIVSKVIPAVLQRTQSNVLAICVPTVFGISLSPPLSRNTYDMVFELDEAHSIVGYRTQTTAPGLTFVCLKTVPRTPGTSNKSLDSYSLRVTGGERQRVAPNGHNRGLNGKLGHLTAILRVRKGVTSSAFGLELSTSVENS